MNAHCRRASAATSSSRSLRSARKNAAGEEWENSRLTFADRLRKRRAVSRYTSQLALLSLGTRKLNLLVLQDEAISWGAA